MADLLIGILGSPARAKILRFLFAAPAECHTAPEVAKHSQVSLPVAKRELKALQKLNVVRSRACSRPSTSTTQRGKVRMRREEGWTVYTGDMYRVLAAFVRDTEPEAREDVLEKLKGIGRTKLIIASGCLVEGEGGPSRLDLLVVGDSINERKVAAALRAIEAQYGREVAYAIFTTSEFKYRYDIRDRLVRDILDYPHEILLDTLRMF